MPMVLVSVLDLDELLYKCLEHQTITKIPSLPPLPPTRKPVDRGKPSHCLECGTVLTHVLPPKDHTFLCPQHGVMVRDDNGSLRPETEVEFWWRLRGASNDPS